MSWKKIINSDPNWSDYIRGAGWSFTGSVIVTLGLKFESWDTFPILLLILASFLFFVSAYLWTLLSNQIKSYQSKYSDLKLITRSRNNFGSKGESFYNNIHKHLTNDRIEYPDFIVLGQYIDNIESKKDRSENSIKFFFAVTTIVLALALVFAAAYLSKKSNNSSKEYYESSTEKLNELILQQDTIKLEYNKSSNHLMLEIESLKIRIDSLRKVCSIKTDITR